VIPEHQDGSSPQESGHAPDFTFYKLTYAFLRSDRFAAYKPNTQNRYKQELIRFLRRAPNSGHIDLPTAIAAVQDAKQQGPKPVFVNTLYAIKAAITWGIERDIVDSEIGGLANQLVDHRKQVHEPITPLSEPELQRLFAAASGNLRDRALITTVVIAQPTNEELELLKKDSVYKGADGQTVIKIGDKEVPVQEGIAPFILDYAKTLKQESALFPRTLGKDKTVAMTRAGVYVILSKYKKQAELPSLSHKVLAKTGQQLFGKTRRIQTQTPQIPLP